jgi:hypothetical protein
MQHLKEFLIRIQTFGLRIIEDDIATEIGTIEKKHVKAYDLTYQTQYYDSFSYRSELRVLKDMAFIDLIALDKERIKLQLAELTKVRIRFKEFWSNYSILLLLLDNRATTSLLSRSNSLSISSSSATILAWSRKLFNPSSPLMRIIASSFSSIASLGRIFELSSFCVEDCMFSRYALTSCETYKSLKNEASPLTGPLPFNDRMVMPAVHFGNDLIRPSLYRP